jgi:predicted acyl esterase
MQKQSTSASPYTLTFDKDVPIPMSDGNVLRANVFRPTEPGNYPVVMAMGIYGKDAHFEDAFGPQWKILLQTYPELCSNGSTGKYLRWENVDPERWIPDGYVVVTVDSRGSGKSPGYLDPFSALETRDFYEAIEWAGTQPWSNGKVGLLGVSYFAMKQWQVAALQPPHLAAIIPWEGASNFYRDGGNHGGIFSNSFTFAWWPRQVLVNQHGSGNSPYRDRETGERTTGPAISEEMLRYNRANHPQDRLGRPLDDAWQQEHSPQLGRIQVPLLSAANWGGPGMHLRGNLEGYSEAGADQKWLFAHIGTHYESFYLPHYVALQKRFFDRFLKSEKNGWDDEPPVQLAIRKADGSATIRKEHEWPLARTQWTKFNLDASSRTLTPETQTKSSQASYKAGEGEISFSSAPFDRDVEFTGPIALRLCVSTTTTDMDIFAVVRMFDQNGQEAVFTGAHEKVPVALGWLRASHRKLDAMKSKPWRPYHSHDEIQKLVPGEVCELDVEIWPTSMVYPKGYRLVLTIKGHDFVVTPPGRMLHNHIEDRNPAEFGGKNTLHTGGVHTSFLLMPLIPG